MVAVCAKSKKIIAAKEKIEKVQQRHTPRFSFGTHAGKLKDCHRRSLALGLCIRFCTFNRVEVGRNRLTKIPAQLSTEISQFGMVQCALRN